MLPDLQDLVEKVGFNHTYYTAINSSFDLPYDFYKPEKSQNKTQIELIYPDGELIELSSASELVRAIAGETKGDQRFYFPDEMLASSTLDNYTLFEDSINTFNNSIKNGEIIKKDV